MPELDGYPEYPVARAHENPGNPIGGWWVGGIDHPWGCPHTPCHFFSRDTISEVKFLCCKINFFAWCLPRRPASGRLPSGSQCLTNTTSTDPCAAQGVTQREGQSQQHTYLKLSLVVKHRQITPPSWWRFRHSFRHFGFAGTPPQRGGLVLDPGGKLPGYGLFRCTVFL